MRHATTETRASTISSCSVTVAHGRARRRPAKSWRLQSVPAANLPFYPRGIQLTGIDFSPAMLDIARDRAAKLAIDITLLEADAQHLPFADDRFDTRLVWELARAGRAPRGCRRVCFLEVGEVWCADLLCLSIGTSVVAIRSLSASTTASSGHRSDGQRSCRDRVRAGPLRTRRVRPPATAV
jgi:SAM-dependent methyltransferase